MYSSSEWYYDNGLKDIYFQGINADQSMTFEEWWDTYNHQWRGVRDWKVTYYFLQCANSVGDGKASFGIAKLGITAMLMLYSACTL